MTLNKIEKRQLIDWSQTVNWHMQKFIFKETTKMKNLCAPQKDLFDKREISDHGNIRKKQLMS